MIATGSLPGSRSIPAISVALALLILQAFCAASGRPARAQEAAGALSEAEVEKRRKALGEWVFEPVALDNSTYLLHMDRHTSSFLLTIRRSNVSYYSSWNRKGFCSIRLANGKLVPVDKIEDLNANSDRIRFRAASSLRELPAVWIEWRKVKNMSLLSLVFDVPEESRKQVAGIRLLDRALWVSDSDDGEILLPRGVGELHPASKAAPLALRLDHFQGPARDSTETAWSQPVLGLNRLSGPLALAWSEPETVLSIEREEVGVESRLDRSGILLELVRLR